MPSLNRSMFGVTGMNVVMVEKTRPCLRSGCLRSGRVQSICSRLKDQWRRYAVLKDLKNLCKCLYGKRGCICLYMFKEKICLMPWAHYSEKCNIIEYFHGLLISLLVSMNNVHTWNL